MIAILDPGLLLTSAHAGILAPNEEQEIQRVLADVNRLLRDTRAVVPQHPPYWRPFERELVNLYRRCTANETKTALDQLRSFVGNRRLPPKPQHGTTKLWGLRALYDWQILKGQGWLPRMEEVIVGCAQIDEPSLLVVRLFSDRNRREHPRGRGTLIEKTQWRIYAHVPGRAPKAIPCVTHTRNLSMAWTARYDHRLPESGRFPFCPIDGWWRRRTQAVRTIRSKPAFVDHFGNGWTKPSAGGDLHWDVFIEDSQLRETVGIDALNVVPWGTREPNKMPGELHHVPREKRARLNEEASWQCPGMGRSNER